MKLQAPKSKHTKAKLAAYTRHWSAIADIQGELNSRWIHLNLKDQDVATTAQLANSTVKRFRQFGRGQGKSTYSYFYGPSATTIFGIVDALGLKFTLQQKGPNNAKHR